MTKRVSILGSCATRDAFEFVPSQFEVGEYIARTSISTLSKTALSEGDFGNTQKLSSGFQQRMVDIELGRETLSLLNNDPSDILVIDFIDERFHVGISEETGAWFTLSNEARSFGLAPFADALRLVDERYSEFEEGLLRLFEQIDTKTIVVNAVDYAVEDDEGNPLQEQKFSLEKNRNALLKFYEISDKLGCRLIDYPDGIFVAQSNHKWGRSPFHYTKDVYEHFINELTAISNKE